MIKKTDDFGCIGNTIKVAAGHYFDLLRPDPALIDLWSIATALSMTCRYGGHTPRFYSVAEHCVIAAGFALEDGLDEKTVQAVLLHDAAEAFIGDIVKPLKIALPDYQAIEDRMEAAIEKRFDVRIRRQPVIKAYDRRMYITEKRNMWPEDTTEWLGEDTITPYDIALGYWPPVTAKNQFLIMARDLKIDDTTRVPT